MICHASGIILNQSSILDVPEQRKIIKEATGALASHSLHTPLRTDIPRLSRQTALPDPRMTFAVSGWWTTRNLNGPLRS